MVNSRAVSGRLPIDTPRQTKQHAERLYRQTCDQVWLAQIWSLLKRRRSGLLALTQFKAADTVTRHHYIGKQWVRLSQIRGSSSQTRCYDFDADFRPLNAHNRTRWLGVATAWQLGKILPPIDLIQVGQVYFVEDGHHRISVAKAMGQQEIEAVVTVWEVAAGDIPA